VFVRPSTGRLLLIEDNPADADLVSEHLEGLEKPSPSVEWVGSLAEGLKRLDDGDGFTAVLLDLNLPDSTGLGTLDRVLEQGATLPVIVLTGVDPGGLGVQAVARGASDFLPKDEVTGPVLARSIRYAVERHHRRRLEAQYHALVESSRDLVMILDRDLTIRYVSPSLLEILGYRAEEQTGADLFAQVHPKDRDAVQDEISRLLTDGEEPAHFRYKAGHRDGGWRMLDTIAQDLFDDPHIRGLVVHARDVTEWLTLEERLRQAERMEVIGRLAGGVAHDFNNLLTAVEGHARLLLEEVGEDAALRGEVEEIRRAGQRAAALTRQLLAFSRGQTLQERPVDLGEVTLDVRRMLRRLVPEDIILEMDSGEEAVVVRADPGQLRQVVVNLVVNAADAIEDGGRISVTVDATELSSEESDALPWESEPGPYGRLTVADDGTGMSSEVVEHVFEPFFTTKPEGIGTGLGLSTVYGIVKQSGGHVFVDSAPGEGTTFEVFLPRAEEAVEEAGEEMEPPISVEGSVVLLVEDDEAVRNVARRILSRAGCEVLEAPDGRSALQVADRESGSIDIVISDVVMPEMGGVELYKRLTAEHPGLKVVLTSGYSEREMRSEIREMGARFLPKPFTPDSLLRCMAEALSS